MKLDIVKNHITNSDDWGLSQLRLADLSKPVTYLHFAAHANVDNAGDHAAGEKVSPTNHWSLSLDTGLGATVQVDAVPNDLGKLGMIILESRNSPFSGEDDIIHAVSIETPKEVTVASLLHHMISEDRDQYVFVRMGEGCRFWLYTLAQDF